MKTKIMTLIMVLFFAVILCGVVSAEDVGNNTTGLADTPWPKFQSDSNNTGQSNYTGPQTNTTEWTYNTQDVVNQNSNIVIGADGTIYFGNRNKNFIYALYSNGTSKWNCSIPSSVFSLVIGKNGIIYAGSGGNGHYVYAFKDNGNNATLKWTYDTLGAVRGLAIGFDGVLYFGSQTSAPTQYRLNALEDNGDNATIKWVFTTSNINYGVPAIGADGTIYFGSTDQYLYALNPSDGSLKWKYKTGGGIQSSPTIGSDGTIYVGSGDGKVYAFSPVQDPANPQYNWIYNTEDGGITNSAPSIAKDGTIYIGTSTRVHAITSDGNKKWAYNIGASIQSSALIGADGTIYIGNNAGYVYAFSPEQDPANPQPKWTYRTGLSVNNLALGPNGALYFGSGKDTSNYRFYSVRDPAPVANFTANATNGTGSLTVKFTDTSIRSPTSWLWDFGDDETSTEQNPTHTYTTPGTYTVKLTASNPAGNDTITKTSYITVLDTIAPTVTANPVSGNYDTIQSVTLTADEQATIYYTTDGSIPTTSSTQVHWTNQHNRYYNIEVLCS